MDWIVSVVLCAIRHSKCPLLLLLHKRYVCMYYIQSWIPLRRCPYLCVVEFTYPSKLEKCWLTVGKYYLYSPSKFYIWVKSIVKCSLFFYKEIFKLSSDLCYLGCRLSWVMPLLLLPIMKVEGKGVLYEFIILTFLLYFSTPKLSLLVTWVWTTF